MRAFSFRQAIDEGCVPRSYDSPVPEGECFARLGIKVWDKNSILRCFFIEIEPGVKFSLPAFRFHSGQDIRQYSPRDKGVDFSEPGIEHAVYELIIGRGQRGGIAWKEGTPTGNGTGTVTGAE